MLRPTLTMAVSRAEDRRKWGSSLWELAAELTSGARHKGSRLPALRPHTQTLCPRGQFSSSKSSVEAFPFFTWTFDKASSLWATGLKSQVRDIKQDPSGRFFWLRNHNKGSALDPLRPPRQIPDFLMFWMSNIFKKWRLQQELDNFWLCQKKKKKMLRYKCHVLSWLFIEETLMLSGKGHF